MVSLGGIELTLDVIMTMNINSDVMNASNRLLKMERRKHSFKRGTSTGSLHPVRMSCMHSWQATSSGKFQGNILCKSMSGKCCYGIKEHVYSSYLAQNHCLLCKVLQTSWVLETLLKSTRVYGSLPWIAQRLR